MVDEATGPIMNNGSTSLKEVFETYRDEHRREHERIERQNEKDMAAVDVRFRDSQESHQREHVGHAQSHDNEHRLTNLALEKAEDGVNQQVAGVLSKIEDQGRSLNERVSRVEQVQASRSGLEATVMGIDTRLDTLEKVAAAAAGMSTEVAGLATRISSIENLMSAQAGKAGGSEKTIGYILAGLGALATVVSLLVIFLNLAR